MKTKEDILRIAHDLILYELPETFDEDTIYLAIDNATCFKIN